MAADCPPSTAIGELALNNVKFWIETGGNMWEDRPNGNPFYIVPKLAPDGSDGQNSVLFAGSLWMGGTDPADNLKMAAVRFRQNGNDFWPGPLTNDGTASIDLMFVLNMTDFGEQRSKRPRYMHYGGRE